MMAICEELGQAPYSRTAKLIAAIMNVPTLQELEDAKPQIIV